MSDQRSGAGTGGPATTPRGDEDLPPRNAEDGARARPFADRQSAPDRADDPAAGTVDHPITPGEAQAGDLSEQAANLGGPVDIFPLRDRARKERPPG